MRSNGTQIYQQILKQRNLIGTDAAIGTGTWPPSSCLNSTEYFKTLVTYYIKDFGLFGEPSTKNVYAGTNANLFTAKNNAWKVIADLGDGDAAQTPFLISKNVFITRLSDIKQTDSLAAHLGAPILYDNSRVVIVWKDGSSIVLPKNTTGVGFWPTNLVLCAGDESAITDKDSGPEKDTKDREKPDFMITTITLEPSSPKAGDLFTATISVFNNSGTKGDPGTLAVWLDHSDNASGSEASDTNVVVDAIEGRRSCSIKIADLKATEKGIHTFRAFIDSKEQSSEKSESNNQKSMKYECK